jgi:hypothetical protein
MFQFHTFIHGHGAPPSSLGNLVDILFQDIIDFLIFGSTPFLSLPQEIVESHLIELGLIIMTFCRPS